MLTIILIVILILLLLGAFPRAPWYGTAGAQWGYGPMGIIGVILIIILILALTDRLPLARF